MSLRICLLLCVKALLPSSRAAPHAASPCSRLATNDGKCYFAYGSNLLSARMHIRNKDAVHCGTALLPDWRLEFAGSSSRWHGSPANVVPAPGDSVMGVLWSVADVRPLDQQEDTYTPVHVSVQELASGAKLSCRVYSLTQRQRYTSGAPSKLLKSVMLAGARESHLPAQYISRVEAVSDNGDSSAPISRLISSALA